MITVGEDKIAIEWESREITFAASGDSMDPIEVRLTGSKTVIVLHRRDIEIFQLSLLNFLNTGYFDQEG